jgi:hypothetical protein
MGTRGDASLLFFYLWDCQAPFWALTEPVTKEHLKSPGVLAMKSQKGKFKIFPVLCAEYPQPFLSHRLLSLL